VIGSRRDHPASRRGASSPSVLVALAVAALAAGAASVAVRRHVARQRVVVSAQGFVSELRLRRMQAIAGARRLGLAFERAEDGSWLVALHEDGDGDGIRADDRRRGRDPLLEGPVPFDERHGPASPGFLPGLEELDSPPPGSRPLDELDDPVRFGRGDVVAFGPRGTMTSGTLYLTDGVERQWAVVVHGPTGRLRRWEWLVDDERWRVRRLEPARDDLPPRLSAPGLDPTPMLVWSRDDQGKLIQDLVFQ